MGELKTLEQKQEREQNQKGGKNTEGLIKNPHDEEAKRDADKANNRQVKTKEAPKTTVWENHLKKLVNNTM